jgi:hypothetical protein
MDMMPQMSCFRRIRDATHVFNHAGHPCLRDHFLAVYKNGANDYATKQGLLGLQLQQAGGCKDCIRAGTKQPTAVGTRGFILAGMALALSGCVSGGDPAMFTSVQGFVPNPQDLAENAATTQVADGFSYEATGNRIRIRRPSANALTDSSGCTLPVCRQTKTRRHNQL